MHEVPADPSWPPQFQGPRSSVSPLGRASEADGVARLLNELLRLRLAEGVSAVQPGSHWTPGRTAAPAPFLRSTSVPNICAPASVFSRADHIQSSFLEANSLHRANPLLQGLSINEDYDVTLRSPLRALPEAPLNSQMVLALVTRSSTTASTRSDRCMSSTLTEQGASIPTWPSVGSQRHHEPGCRPCLYFYRGLCHRGQECSYCHLPHSQAEVARIRPAKRTRLRLLAGLPLLPGATSI